MSDSIDDIIRSRKTSKVFSNEPLGGTTNRRLVEELLASAAWAPFHRPVANDHLQPNDLSSPVPWRAHILDVENCRELRRRLIDSGDSGNLPRMLAAAEAMLQFTWLPNPPSGPSDQLFEPTLANMEHIAAASAAIQNLLLAATARDIPTYWSSGGALREKQAFVWLGIPSTEILLGAVFLFPQDLDSLEVAPGKLRDKRGKSSDWSRWVRLEAGS